MTQDDERPNSLWVGRRYFEGRRAAEVARWTKQDAKREIASLSNIVDPKWMECNEWSEDVEIADLSDSERVVVTELHVE